MKLLNIYPIIKTYISNIHLQTKLIWVNLLAVVIPISIVFIFTFSVYTQYLNEQLKISEFRSLSQISINFERYLNEISILCQRFSIESNLSDVLHGELDYENPQQGIANSTLILNEMRNVLSSHNEILGCYLFCENGNQYKLQRSIAVIENPNDQAWYIAAKNAPNENMLFASNMLSDFLSYDIPVLTFQRGFSDDLTGEFLGVVLYTIDASYFDSLLSTKSIVKPNALMITDTSGRIFYHSEKEYINKLVISNDFMKNIVPTNEFYYVHQFKNLAPIAIFSTTSATNRYKVVEFLPQNSFLEPIREIQLISVFLYILCIGLLLILITSLSSRMTRPLRTLTKKLENFRNPEASRAVVLKPKNEINMLNDSFNNMMTRIDGLIDNVYTAQIQQRESELNALQSKVNPHFLYNTLEMISGMANESKTEEVTKATRSLGKLLQYSLRFENELVTVREEIVNINHYLAIQQMRFGNRFHIIIDFSPKSLDYHILKLIIQPLIENSIFHGLEPKIGEGTILISGNVLNGSDLEIIVADNGVGIPYEDQIILNESLASGINGFVKDTEKNGININRGFALMNIHSRLQLRYGSESGLTIKSSPHEGTTVTLLIKSAKTSVSEDDKGGRQCIT